MKKLLASILVAVCALATSHRTDATPVILLDRSPDAFPNAIITPTYNYPSWGDWTNERSHQHFADSFSFSMPVVLTGMSIYNNELHGAVGQLVSIQLFADDNGNPGTLLSEFTELIADVNADGATRPDAVLVRQRVVDFSVPLFLSKDTTYWIGMSGGTIAVQWGITQAGLNAADDGSMAQFFADTFTGHTGSFVGDASMRLYGNPVPDSGATAALLPLALVALVAFRRRT